MSLIITTAEGRELKAEIENRVKNLDETVKAKDGTSIDLKVMESHLIHLRQLVEKDVSYSVIAAK